MIGDSSQFAFTTMINWSLTSDFPQLPLTPALLSNMTLMGA